MTIKEAITKGMIMLKSNNIESPKLKARLLLQYVIDKTRKYIVVYDNKEITKKQQWEYFVNIEKITKGIPLQHITHRQEFMKMDFFVDENTLIPRQDTEILVEEVIKIANKMMKPKILDLCTGSGIIAISLKKYIPNAEVTGIDISEKALDVANKNAQKLNTEVKFLKSDLFENIGKNKFDIIVSNPPYIKKEEIKKLSKEVQKEPEIALDGGYDGLDFYRRILDRAINYLKTGSYLCLEIGYNQKEDVMKLIEEKQDYKKTYCKKDLYGCDRIIITQVI